MYEKHKKYLYFVLAVVITYECTERNYSSREKTGRNRMLHWAQDHASYLTPTAQPLG